VNASGRVIGKEADCLIIPIRDIQTNKVQGCQCINRNGDKQTFGPMSGGGLLLGNTLDLTLPWYVVEGWASAYSMVFHHHRGNAVCACAFGKSSLERVAQNIAEHHQPDEITILREVD
jgi:putative DNA primase/helicase